ncbi:hypothetical protein ES705_37548 [subsurface metagenome]
MTPNLLEELGLDGDKPDPQQEIPIVRICWDDLFAFLRKLLKPRTAKPVTKLYNQSITSTKMIKAIEWIIPDSVQGELAEISLYSDRFPTTRFEVMIAKEKQLTDQQIETVLSLPYRDLPIMSLQEVKISARTTDGVATQINISLIGKEVLIT